MNNMPPDPLTRTGNAARWLGRGAVALLAILFFWQIPAVADETGGTSLQDLQFSALPGNRVQIVVTASGPMPKPTSFMTENPARIAVDLAGVTSALSKQKQMVGVGMVRSISTVEAGGRTRVVINLISATPHEVTIAGNQLIVSVGGGATGVAAGAGASAIIQAEAAPVVRGGSGAREITKVDFRRGGDGDGRVIVGLSDPLTVVNLNEEAGQIVLDFFDTGLPEALARRLDVTDFATPVQTITTRGKRDGSVRMVIEPAGEYDYLAYQTEGEFVVEFRPLTKAEQAALEAAKQVFTGERLSLNFQDIEIRAVLQLLADFTDLNIVVSDRVTGNITLRLKNVPWDQAMDIILKTKGLAQRRTDNVILVAPTEEIAAHEKLELESQQQIEELAPLHSEFVQINYAKAANLAALLKSADNRLLSERGQVNVDERTNTLMVQDTAAKLADVHRLIQKLDVPVRQVLVEARVVIANNDFSKDLGVRFGFNGKESYNDHFAVVGGGVNGHTEDTAGIAPGFSDGSIENLLVNLPAADPSGAVNFVVGKIGSYLLQLELSAMQREGRGEIVSSPRVITADNQEAIMKQGVEIPYQEATSSGATSTTFKDAVLELRVTPNITPDDRVIMKLNVKKDNPDFSRQVNGVPPVDTREVTTNVRVDNGETVVLGGVFERTKSENTERVPFFGDVPYLGFLFKETFTRDDNSELLIFITPKILKDSLAGR